MNSEHAQKPDIKKVFDINLNRVLACNENGKREGEKRGQGARD